MDVTKKITDRQRLESELAVYLGVYNAYKAVVGLDQPEATKLGGKLLGAIGEALRQIKRTQAQIAKMENGQKPS